MHLEVPLLEKSKKTNFKKNKVAKYIWTSVFCHAK